MAKRNIIKITGIKKLQKKLKKNRSLKDVRKVVKMNTAELEELMKAKTETAFTQGYATSTTKNSIALTIEDGGLTGVVQPHTEYSAYVEFGTRYMSAEPFVKPSYLEQKIKFMNDMRSLFK